MERRAGVLLSISSLPSREGIGTLGQGAYDFVDFLAEAGFKVWQVLPLTPTREGNSPYSSICENALNPLFIDCFDLVERGLLTVEEVEKPASLRVDYPMVSVKKRLLLRLAFCRFDRTDPDFVAFERAGEFREFALFSTLSESFGNVPFWEWDEWQTFDPAKLPKFLDDWEERYLYYVFTQFVFDRQWKKLKAYANARGISIFGDMPIYVAMNSAEVYFHPELFLFDERRKPVKIAGVPPDYFNAEGQLWGNPLYDWEAMKKDGYAWWKARIRRELTRFDMLRIDHFRGLDRFYAIDPDAKDAKHGVWMAGPGAALFEDMRHLPIVAEDLGHIDDSLKAMLSAVGFPGMKVFEFGLDADPWSEHKPANYVENVVGYTGTHDNMPFRGCLDALEKSEFATAARVILVQATALSVLIPTSLDLAAEITEEKDGKSVKQRRIDHLESLTAEDFEGLSSKKLTDLAVDTLLASKARLAVVPLQDLLALGEESRMNTPALVSEENWSWRFDPAAITPTLISRLQKSLKESKRA